MNLACILARVVDASRKFVELAVATVECRRIDPDPHRNHRGILHRYQLGWMQTPPIYLYPGLWDSSFDDAPHCGPSGISKPEGILNQFFWAAIGEVLQMTLSAHWMQVRVTVDGRDRGGRATRDRHRRAHPSLEQQPARVSALSPGAGCPVDQDRPGRVFPTTDPISHRGSLTRHSPGDTAWRCRSCRRSRSRRPL